MKRSEVGIGFNGEDPQFPDGRQTALGNGIRYTDWLLDSPTPLKVAREYQYSHK
jgi:hypothetical protein